MKKLTIAEAVKLAKPFVGSTRATKNLPTRAVIKTALITEEYVIATDSHILIRLKHDGVCNPESRLAKEGKTLFHYMDLTKNLDAASYPDTSRLMPDPDNAKSYFTINVDEWTEAHEAALIAAEVNDPKNAAVNLKENRIEVKAKTTKKVNVKGDSKKGIKAHSKEVAIPPNEQIGFSYTLDSNTLVETVYYNCKYMLQILKTAKKLKEQEIKVYFYGPLRPMLFVTDDMEALVLPVRMY